MYRELFDAVRRHGGQFAPHLLKYLDKVYISDWSDLTRGKLEDLRDAMTDEVAKSSAKTYLAKFKAIVDRYKDEPEINIPYPDVSAVVHLHGDDTVKTYLTKEEIDSLASVQTTGELQAAIKAIFMVGAYTGMRTSDICAVRPENIGDDSLTYVSIKTGVRATIPLHPKVMGYIRYIQAHRKTVDSLSRAIMNHDIKVLCRKAGVTKKVSVHRGGKTRQGEKWRFVTMHTARISFCTNLAKLNVNIYDIAKLAGHRSVGTTEKYIVSENVALSDVAMGYFR